MKLLRPVARGFASIAALFLLVVLAALGAFMVTTSTSQQVSSGLDVQGSRAYWAARAGIEWALGALAVSHAACPTPSAPFTVDGFTLVMSCSRQTFNEGGTVVELYALSARAFAGGSAGGMAYVERSLSASVSY